MNFPFSLNLNLNALFTNTALRFLSHIIESELVEIIAKYFKELESIFVLFNDVFVGVAVVVARGHI